MEKIKNRLNWAVQNSFFISAIIFAFFYARWFWLTPSNKTLTVGIVWVVVNLIIAIIFRTSINRTCLGKFFLPFSVIIFLANVYYIYFNMPKVLDSAKYDGVTYYLVRFPIYTDPPPSTYQIQTGEKLTKWFGGFRYESNYIENRWKDVRLFYDSKSNLVSVVVYSDDEEWLIYTDNKPPRYYEHSVIDFENHRYYLSRKRMGLRNNVYGQPYPYYRYTIYQCELNNTNCVVLPFQYEGFEYDSWISLNEASQEIEFYTPSVDPEDTLVYSFGDHPRCHVEGCEILQP